MSSERIKSIFFWALVVLFFITASFLILYSFGYQFNTERGIFIHGGSITVKSNPEDVSVVVHDYDDATKRTNRLNNSYHIDRIRPGEYLVEVQADGFKSWTKKAIIKSGLSTEFWNVTLIKDSYEKIEYDAKNVEKFYISPKGKLLAYTKNSKEGIFSINILDIENNESSEVFSSKNLKFTEDEKKNIEWSPNGEKIIIPAREKEDDHIIIVNVKNKEFIDITDIAKTNRISNVRWHPKDKDVLYYMSKRSLYMLDIRTENTKLIAQQISSYDISEEDIFFFQLPNGIVFKTNLSGESAPLQVTTRSPIEMDDDEYEITAYDEKRITLLNESGDLYIYNITDKNEYFENLSYGAKGSQFSNDGKKLLYWTNNEIFAYFIQEWDTQPKREENQTVSITRLSKQIKNVQWSGDYEHIIFTFNNNIKVIELDHRDKRNIFDILQFQYGKAEVINDTGEKKIYYTDKSESDEINLFSIDFPEKVGLLTFR